MDWKDTGKEEFRTVGYTEKEGYRKEECRTVGMRNRRDTGQLGCRTFVS